MSVNEARAPSLSGDSDGVIVAAVGACAGAGATTIALSATHTSAVVAMAVPVWPLTAERGGG